MKNHVFSLLAAILLALPNVASAQYNSLFDSPSYNTRPSYENKYDWRTGNSYNIRRDSLGNTHIRGFNTRTGSMWNQSIDSQGNQRGMDSKGNMWNYNRRSGTYWNTDGTFCTGKGAYRICN